MSAARKDRDESSLLTLLLQLALYWQWLDRHRSVFLKCPPRCSLADLCPLRHSAHTATQFDTIADYSCDDKAKYGRLFDEATCDSIRSKVPTCQRLVGYCHANPSRFTCVPATLSCWQVAGPIQQSGLNPYDVTKKCDRAEDKDGPLCCKSTPRAFLSYPLSKMANLFAADPEMAWIETYLNQDHVKKELGAASDRTFESCNMQINQAFTFNGDSE